MMNFEQAYLDCRRKEGRIYSDEIVRQLPIISKTHQHFFEWRVRAHSAQKLNKYVIDKEVNSILEIGCGNGWLSNYLSKHRANVTGLDVNKLELAQAERLFPDIDFIHGDLATQDPLGDSRFDLIIMASVIQYFPNIQGLIDASRKKLNLGGEIHILDSPIYDNTDAADQAKQRSITYFNKHDSSMTDHYFHHHVNILSTYELKWLWRPNNFRNRLNKLLKIPMSPFPWLCIK